MLLQPNPPTVPDDIGAVSEERVDKRVLRHGPVRCIVLHGQTNLSVEKCRHDTPEQSSLGAPVELTDDGHADDESGAEPKSSWCVPKTKMIFNDHVEGREQVCVCKQRTNFWPQALCERALVGLLQMVCRTCTLAPTHSSSHPRQRF